ncbi:MAG: hypothetical protein IPJ67_03565 [Candidatus Moraniibacteriota bacterium]|nr:MAG: hypothetical protein IPJ67_03565 [Candidatus Moranbacteria bacterium]
MKMKCSSTPGAKKGSPHSFSEVDVSEEVYEVKCSEEEARSSCFGELLGRRLRVILTEDSHYIRDPEYFVVTPEDVEYALFYGMRKEYLRIIQS